MANEPNEAGQRVHSETFHVEAKASASFDAKVRRGEKSWSYLYTVLGFALTVEAGVVALITPLKWPWNLLTFLILAAISVYLILANAWFQNKLLGIKAKYEDKFR